MVNGCSLPVGEISWQIVSFHECPDCDRVTQYDGHGNGERIKSRSLDNGIRFDVRNLFRAGYEQRG